MNENLELVDYTLASTERGIVFGIHYKDKNGKSDTFGISTFNPTVIEEVYNEIRSEATPINGEEMTARLGVYLCEELKKTEDNPEKAILCDEVSNDFKKTLKNIRDNIAKELGQIKTTDNNL